jgi:glycosyltransferase involved in cell wall biosynthesis
MQLAIVSTYPPQPCGIGTYTSYLAEELMHAGCDVTVLTEWLGRPLSNSGLKVRPCFDGEADYVDRIVDAVAEAGADIVHIQHEFGIFGFDDRFPSLLGALRRRGYPTVVTLHTVHTALSIDLGCAHRAAHHPPLDFDVERYQSRICELASLVIVHQDRTIRQVLVRQGASPDRTVVIPHGTLVPIASPRTQVRTSLGVKAAKPLIVALGYFEPAKNSLLLLDALAALHEVYPHMKAIVGGHIRHPVPETLAYLGVCEDYVNRRSMADYLTIVSRELTEQEMSDLFAAADVACFVYREDTRSASGALHRALGCGALVVASRITKFEELGDVADELLVSPYSSRELVRLLARLVENGNFRDTMARRLAGLVERTAWPLVSRRHIALYAASAKESVRKRALSALPA